MEDLLPSKMGQPGSVPLQRLSTPRAVIELHVPASPALIDRLPIDSGVGAFWHYKDGKGQKGLLCSIAAEQDGYVAVAVANGAIVAYNLICRPSPHERWSRVAGVHELTIEVSRNWRQLGLAHRLMQLTFADPAWERRVIVAQGYNWHWDMEQTGLSVWEYREMFHRLFEYYGFAVFESDDPEIYLEKANILMARIGTVCSSSLRRAFYEDLYRTMRRPEWLEALLRAA